jgi:hypothetical protein
MPKATVPNTSITRLAPTIVRERNMRRGTSGAGWRDSMSANITSRAAEPARRRMVCGSPQPVSGASTTA